MSIVKLDPDWSEWGQIVLQAYGGEMRIPSEVLSCVVYIGVASRAGVFAPRGTGFIAKVVRDGIPAYYLVTADHVRRKLLKKFAIRVNNANGVSEVRESVDRPRWWTHPTDKTVDVAVYPCSLWELPFSAFPTTDFVTDADFQKNKQTLGVGIGDEVFIVGLFREMAGQTQITPIVRCGHFAMRATERIETDNYGDALFHLVEAFTTAGLSGSPVFVQETIFFRYLPPGSDALSLRPAMAVGRARLLGLIHGMIPIETIIELKGKVRNEKQAWNSGLSTVVPSDKILEVINQPELIEYEKTIERQ
jgi:hypothetical protein